MRKGLLLNRSRRVLFTAMVALGLFVCWVILAPYIATHLIIVLPLQNADLIVVLSGSRAYKERTRLAAELYLQQPLAKIVISDDGDRAGWSEAEQANPSFIELARRELVQSGVPENAIIQLPLEVKGTIGEARAVSYLAAQMKVGTVLLVTSPYHTRRAYHTFSKEFASRSVKVGVAATTITRDSPAPRLWWLSPAGWQNIAAEYVKTVYYWAFY